MKTDFSDIRFAGDGRLKLLITVGTRPEIIRLAAVINKCRHYFDCLLAHTGQNYDYNLKYTLTQWAMTSARRWATSSTRATS